MSQTKLAYVIFCFEGIVCLETNNMVLVPLMRLYGRCDLPPPCAKRKNSFAVDIYQVSLSGPERRVWRDDLAPVDVLMSASAVAIAEFGWLWQECQVRYQCFEGTLGSGGRSTL